MNIYLAARYSRREELCGYREQLRELGHVVDAVWLNGSHQISDGGNPIGEESESLVEGDDDGSSSDRAAKLCEQFAIDDLRDVQNCDLLIAFTEPPRSNASRGGRHVELGIAIGLGKMVAIVGPRENIFCWLPEVLHFESLDVLLAWEKQELTF